MEGHRIPGPAHAAGIDEKLHHGGEFICKAAVIARFPIDFDTVALQGFLDLYQGRVRGGVCLGDGNVRDRGADQLGDFS